MTGDVTVLRPFIFQGDQWLIGQGAAVKAAYTDAQLSILEGAGYIRIEQPAEVPESAGGLDVFADGDVVRIGVKRLDFQNGTVTDNPSTGAVEVDLGSGGGGSGPSGVREEMVVTMTALAQNTIYHGMLALKSAVIIRVEASVTGWLAMYGTDAARTADHSRLLAGDEAVAPATPLPLEILFSPTLDVLLRRPKAFANQDDPALAQGYFAFRRSQAGTSDVTLTFTLVQLEG